MGRATHNVRLYCICMCAKPLYTDVVAVFAWQHVETDWNEERVMSEKSYQTDE